MRFPGKLGKGHLQDDTNVGNYFDHYNPVYMH